jgi:hypothetical protein
MTIFWLILWGSIGGPVAPIHAGNFPTMEACQAAAQRAKSVVVPEGSPSAKIFICVQANATGTIPPEN